MNWVDAVILGIVEGVTEYLPVSSTGHLILAAKLLGLPQTEFMKTFEIAIQIGAILAVVVFYRRTLMTEGETLKRVLAAFLPTAVIGFLLYKVIKKFLFAGTLTVLWFLFLGGVILIIFDRCHREKKDALATPGEIPFWKAAGIGLAQTLSVIPGVSRAAATIVGAMAFGTSRKTAVEFSFLLAVPTLAAATALDLFKNGGSLDLSQWQFLLIGSAVSFGVAMLTIRFFLRFVRNHGLTAFGLYRIGVALLFWGFVR